MTVTTPVVDAPLAAVPRHPPVQGHLLPVAAVWAVTGQPRCGHGQDIPRQPHKDSLRDGVGQVRVYDEAVGEQVGVHWHHAPGLPPSVETRVGAVRAGSCTNMVTSRSR
jgi:hypothetical protein